MKGWNLKRLLLIVLVFISCASHADDGSLFSYATKLYGFAAWRGKTKMSYAQMLTSYDLPDLPLMTNSPGVRVQTHVGKDLKRLNIWHENDWSSSLRVVTGVATNVLAAQEFMVRHLGTCLMGCHDYSFDDIGDRGYSVITNQWSTLVFTRNNIYVEIRSTTSLYSAKDLGRLIDADILRKSTEGRWVRWAVGGLILLGGSLYAARRRRAAK